MAVSALPLERLRRWLLMAQVTSTNPSRRREFCAAFGSLEAAAGAPVGRWRELGLLRHSEVNDIFRAASSEAACARPRDAVDPEVGIERQIQEAERRGAQVVTLEDADYPEILRNTPDPSPLLFVRGDPAALRGTAVAVVGARRASRYGLVHAERIASGLAAHGVGVVSGGARGVDSAAHRGALGAGGATIAVMGSGLDIPYPRENAALFEEIARSGALVSEFPFGTAPEKHHFPIRNRLIAGLSLGTMVIEGKEDSGSMITADLALEANRDVYALPGSVESPLSAGPLSLIRRGAALVRDAEEILSELPWWAREGLRAPSPPPGAPSAEDPAGAGPGRAATAALLAALDPIDGRTADDLAAALSMQAPGLLATLMELELAGKVQTLPGGRYVRRS